nr:MAG TPA: hypothetical protein [Caudoviricetes sp.]
MEEYIRKLKQQLLFESSCVTSRCGRGGGVYEYVQREFAYNECRMDGGELSKRNITSMFESGLIYADEGEMLFRAEDIINADRHFAALQYTITECMCDMTGEDTQEIQRRLGTGQNIPGKIKKPGTLRDIAAFHIDWIKGGEAEKPARDAKTARIIALIQCLQADIIPFIIHAENKTEYESRLDSPERLEQFFRVEQRQFYRETEPMVIDQV